MKRQARATLARAAVLALLVSAALLPLPGNMHAQDTGWTITDFHADYVVHPDGSLGVIERIVVDFDGLERHGIYRTIPVVYKRQVSEAVPMSAGRVRFSLDVREVTDAAGNPLPYDLSGVQNKEIKIGDPDRTVSGRQVYVIDYSLSGGLGFFEEFDELYWQVTGTRWPVPIEHASATVILPPIWRPRSPTAPRGRLAATPEAPRARALPAAPRRTSPREPTGSRPWPRSSPARD